MKAAQTQRNKEEWGALKWRLRRAQNEVHMEASLVEPAVLERIGATLDDVLDDVLTEPLPKNIKDLLADEPHILCVLLDALTNPAQYRINEVDGEVFIFQSGSGPPLPDDRP